MASLINDPGGKRRISFKGSDGARRTIRLGKMPKKAAEAVKIRIEHLVSASMSGHAVDDETARWVASLDDVLRERLANVGLASKRERCELKPWLESYLESRTDLKPGSVAKLRQTVAKLVSFFPGEIPLRDITTNEAADWRLWLMRQDISEASVKIHVGNAKTIFGEAERRELIAKNPFRHLQGGTTPSKVDRYVTPEEADRVIEACPTHEYRVLFGLARLAGLRVTSESHLLTWADVDWDHSTLTVRSPKTERHEGKGVRTVPISPKLYRILQDAFDHAEPGHEYLVTVKDRKTLHGRFAKIIQSAGVEPWPRLFQTLRRSCEIEWASVAPQYAVSKWIGHSIQVSGKHYANSVPTEVYGLITGDIGVAQNAAQMTPEMGEMSRNGSKSKRGQSPVLKRKNPANTSICGVSSAFHHAGIAIPRRGVEPLFPD